jgi:hypothetical protein
MAHLAVINHLAFLGGLGYDPFFRGLLSVLTAILVLIGGTYLVVATNTGSRLGGLISLTGLFGWLFLMGMAWTIYGIGWKGKAPTWDLVEINVDDPADVDDGLLFSEVEDATRLVGGENGIPAAGLGTLGVDAQAVLDRVDDPAAVDKAKTELSAASTVKSIPDPDLAQDAALVASRNLELGDWRYLVTSNSIRGEAQASVDGFLIEKGVFKAGGYVPEQFGAFIIDGKPVLAENANLVNRVTHTLDETILHPYFSPEVIVVQVRGALKQPVLPGQPPPVATVDPKAPLVSVIMERNRGGPIPALFSGLRFTPAMFTVFTGLIFVILAWNLHLRDRRETNARAAVN